MNSSPSVDDYINTRIEAYDTESDFSGEVAGGVKAYLKVLQAYVEELHRTGGSGTAVNRARSDGIDSLLRRLERMSESFYYRSGGVSEGSVTLVAVGGYARREVSLRSDIDLLFLHREPVTELVSTVAEQIQHWLWDAGVTVGSAVRSVSETIRLAKREISIGTNIIDARYLEGDTELYQNLLDSIRSGYLQNPGDFISAQLEAASSRHAKFGESVYLLQPNVKEGAGGLRDYHTAYWISRATTPSIRGLEDLLHFGLLTEKDFESYQRALEFFWRIRNYLHLISNRCTDLMNFEYQEQIASAIGYDDGGDEELPVERFMRDYYLHARTIRNLSDTAIEECLVRNRPKSERQKREVVEEGFVVSGLQLEIPQTVSMAARPERLLLAFATAQHHGVKLSRSAQRVIRENLYLVDDVFREDAQVAEIFDGILGATEGVTSSLITMNEIGLMGAYVPEWTHIVCRWQHVIYHTYTVDIHSIYLVEELRRLWLGKYRDSVPDLTSLIQEADDRPVLFWGCLLHDIGKGRGGDHSDKGAAIAEKILMRVGLSSARIDRVKFLVKEHLLMSRIAQRRDLSDPKVIMEFAKVVSDRERLRDLYLLTFADIRASSTSAWSEWKGRLFRELYEKTNAYLQSGQESPDVVLEEIEERISEKRSIAKVDLELNGFGNTEIERYFSSLPRRYFETHTPKQIVRHGQLVIGYTGEAPIEIAVRDIEGGFSEFLLCAQDTRGLYSQVAGTLTGVDVNILGSHVYTTTDNLALEVYRISTPSGGPAERRLLWSEFKECLVEILSGSRSVEGLLSRRGSIVRDKRSPVESAATVVVSNSESDFYTLIDITANDRRGLLYDLTRILAEYDLDICISKASTVLDQVADTFYVKDIRGRKLTEIKKLDGLRNALLEVV